MKYTGGCHCGAVRYELAGEPRVVALCHCADCRRNAGAPCVAWAMYDEAALTITRGDVRNFNSSGAVQRAFCATCGTGLFYRNEPVLPGVVDVQAATLDDPEALPPAIQIQTAERLAWVAHMHTLPAFERFPGG